MTGARTGVDAASDPDAALEELYAAHWARLVRTAALLVRDTETAEDLVQEAFVALHRRWGQLRQPDQAVGYLRRSVVNGARSALRRRSVATRFLVRHGPAQAERRAEAAEDRALARSGHDDVMVALQRLATRQREVVVLRYYADLSEAETAEMLGISRGAVKSHGSRGLAKLRGLLAEENTEQADGGDER